MVDPLWSSHLRPHFATLVKTMQTNKLLDSLYARELICLEDYKAFMQGNMTEEQKTRKLLAQCLMRTPPGSFKNFCDVLASIEGHKHLAELLDPERRLSCD